MKGLKAETSNPAFLRFSISLFETMSTIENDRYPELYIFSSVDFPYIFICFNSLNVTTIRFYDRKMCNGIWFSRHVINIIVPAHTDDRYSYNYMKNVI